MALSSRRDAVPGTMRDAPPPTALPILPDVIGLPPTAAELIREKGRLPNMSKKGIMEIKLNSFLVIHFKIIRMLNDMN